MIALRSVNGISSFSLLLIYYRSNLAMYLYKSCMKPCYVKDYFVENCAAARGLSQLLAAYMPDLIF